MPAGDRPAPFEPWLSRWRLVPDGAAIRTRAAQLLPVRQEGTAAMLKLAESPEERAGAAVMAWWTGEGAARVLARDGEALLMERAEGGRSLLADARNGRDDAATAILCDAIGVLHTPRRAPRPLDLVPLDVWFRDLAPAAATHGGALARSAAVAAMLLAEPRESVVLHGDVHHDNVLHFGDRGWLAIDPKGLLGEPGFDYANLFCNPDVEAPVPPVAVLPERFAARLAIVQRHAPVERDRLLAWIVAWAGLSAVWYLGDGDEAAVDFAVLEMALAALDG